MNNSESRVDIDISGYINTERKSSPKLLLPIKEGIHNSLEVIRLAILQDPLIKANIDIKFYISEKDIAICCDYNINKLSKRIDFAAIRDTHNEIIALNKAE